MKRQPRNKQNRAVTNSRSLRIESLEDRKLLTVAAEMVQVPQESQIGSEHWPEPAAEIAVEKATNHRQGFFSRGLHNNGAFRGPQETGFSRGLHNNGAFREPTGHILWNASDDSETSSDSYTDSGRITYYAYELKNVLLTSVRDGQGNDKSSFLGIPSCPEVASNWQDRNNVGDKTWNEVLPQDLNLHHDPVFFSHHANVDKVFGENGVGGLDGCPNGLHVDGTSEAADGDSGAATDSIPGGNDDALDSLMADDDDRTDGEDKDDEVPGLPGEDETLTPAGRDFLLDPAKTEGSDGDDIWDVRQGY